MSQKVLDYSSHDGSELFRTDINYPNGEPRWAARSDWFIRFWGYVFEAREPADIPNPGVGRVILFRDSNDGLFKVKLADSVLPLFNPNEIGFDDQPVKAAPINADQLLILDSADDDKVKRTTLLQLRVAIAPTLVTIDDTDSPYTAAFENIVLADPDGDDIDITLPDPSFFPGGRVTVKRISAGNQLTVLPHDTETIDGEADLDIPTDKESVTMISDGTNWFII